MSAGGRSLSLTIAVTTHRARLNQRPRTVHRVWAWSQHEARHGLALSLSSGQILSGSRDELGFGANTTGKRRFRSSSDSHCSGESLGDSLSLIRDAAFHRHRGAQVQNCAEIRKGTLVRSRPGVNGALRRPFNSRVNALFVQCVRFNSRKLSMLSVSGVCDASRNEAAEKTKTE